MKLSVIIPVYNERRTVEECIRRVIAAPYDKELLVVDDGSSDGSADLLQTIAERSNGQVRLFVQPVNRGKGAAVRVGIEHAVGDVVIIQDADLETDPNDYRQVVLPIEQRKADVVYGSRFLATERQVQRYWHSLGNKVLTTLSNMFTDLSLTDMETCYKAFRREVIQNLVLESDRFGFEPEVTAKLAKAPCVIYEVPISYRGRTYAQGKKITWRDGLKAISEIVRYNLGHPATRCFKRDWAEVPNLVDPMTRREFINNETTLTVLAEDTAVSFSKVPR
jgi:glycosyltransferase involved in cell wall biosynthesis